MPKCLIYIVIAVLAVVSGYSAYQLRQPDPPGEVAGFLWPNPKVMSSFELEATSGSDFDLEQLKGKWTFLFFGYTFCPDICPMTLSMMAQVRLSLIHI